jgi:hypothetical protein
MNAWLGIAPKTPKPTLKKPKLTDATLLKTPKSGDVKKAAASATTPGGKAKTQKPKQPPKKQFPKDKKKGPPKAKSAYLFFCAENRQAISEKIKKESLEFKQTEVIKQCGADWKALSDTEKKVGNRASNLDPTAIPPAYTLLSHCSISQILPKPIRSASRRK